MVFSSVEFLVFLVVVFLVTWALARVRIWQTVFLLSASYFFYANWNPYYLVLIWFTSTVDYLAGGAIARTSEQRHRKWYLAASLTADLGVLGIFKYYNFFSTQVATALCALHVSVDPVLLGVALPVGISFFTFQSMSYTIDIYRGELQPTDRYLEYLLFVSFFPQLVAGPIVRAATFLPQLRARRVITRESGGLALFLIMSGLVKKVCIADYLGVNLVDRVFENPSWFTSAEVMAAVYGYAFQIYCDFSGYSDVAIGAALLLGFQLPENFHKPYLAVNLRDFWRRWHISLSTWLRDYLYIPLGGSRHGPRRTYVALAVTMLLGGLWHGAAWTFVIWGALHGVALALTRAWQRWRAAVASRRAEPGPEPGGAARPPSPGRRLVWRVVATVLTFHFVCFAWIFFRSKGLSEALGLLAQIAKGTGGLANVVSTVALALGAAFVLHATPWRVVDAVRSSFSRLPGVAQGVVMVAVGALVVRVAQSQVVPFIYFQF